MPRRTSRRKTIIPVVLVKGSLGKYGYRQILSMSASKRREALANAINHEGYLPIYRKIVLLRTFNKSREHMFKLYDGDVKWMKKNRDSLEHGWYPKKATRRSTRRKSTRRTTKKSKRTTRRKSTQRSTKRSTKRKSTKKTTKRRSTKKSKRTTRRKSTRNVKKVSIPRRKTSSLIIKQSGKKKSDYASSRAYWNRHHRRQADQGHVGIKRHTKKYTERPSPSYSANEYCGKRKRGNDGNWWVSEKSITGICRWVKLK